VVALFRGVHGEVRHGIKRRMCSDSMGRVGDMCSRKRIISGVPIRKKF